MFKFRTNLRLDRDIHVKGKEFVESRQRWIHPQDIVIKSGTPPPSPSVKQKTERQHLDASTLSALPRHMQQTSAPSTPGSVRFLHIKTNLTVLGAIHKWRQKRGGGRGLPKFWRSKGGCVILVLWIGPKCWQGGGGGQKSQKFSWRHLWTAPKYKWVGTSLPI